MLARMSRSSCYSTWCSPPARLASRELTDPARLRAGITCTAEAGEAGGGPGLHTHIHLVPVAAGASPRTAHHCPGSQALCSLCPPGSGSRGRAEWLHGGGGEGVPPSWPPHPAPAGSPGHACASARAARLSSWASLAPASPPCSGSPQAPLPPASRRQRGRLRRRSRGQAARGPGHISVPTWH